MPSNPKPPNGEQFEKMVSQLNKIGREPRAGAIIWHAHIDNYLDWILRIHAGTSERQIKDSSFSKKIRLLEESGVLPKTTAPKLKAINQIRNGYAHDMEIETPEFDAKVRSIIERLEWYNEDPDLYEQYNTNFLFATLANNTLHELHKLLYLRTSAEPKPLSKH